MFSKRRVRIWDSFLMYLTIYDYCSCIFLNMFRIDLFELTFLGKKTDIDSIQMYSKRFFYSQWYFILTGTHVLL